MTNSEMRKIVIESLPSDNEQFNRGLLSSSDKHKSAFSRGLKSSLNSGEYYDIRKRIDEESGKIIMEVVTNARNELNALASIRTTAGNLSASTGASYGISQVLPMYPVKGTVSLTGQQAVANARASILAQPSGSFTPVEGAVGKYSYSYLTSYTDKNEINKERQSLLKESRSISRTETKKVINNYNQESSEDNSIKGNKFSANGNNISIGNEAQQRSTASNIFRIIGILTMIASLVRRILTTVTDYAKQVTQDTVTAHNLNIPYSQAREFRYLEKAHGLKEGTIAGGVQEVQSAFGNITSLDTKALESLALVVPNLEDLIKTGMGGKNPEELAGVILDAFNKRANEGLTSVGTYVGQEQARRELYSYLLKVMPNLASMFSTMQEEQHNVNSLYRNMSGTYDEWKRSMNRGIPSMTVTEQGILYTLGEEANMLTATFQRLKETLAKDFSVSLLSLIDKINKIKIGMSAEDKIKTGEEAKTENIAYAKKLKSKIATLKETDVSGLPLSQQLLHQATLQTYEHELITTENMLNKPIAEMTSVVPTENMVDNSIGFLYSMLLAKNSKEIMKDIPAYTGEVYLNSDVEKAIEQDARDATEKAMKAKTKDKANEFANELAIAYEKEQKEKNEQRKKRFNELRKEYKNTHKYKKGEMGESFGTWFATTLSEEDRALFEGYINYNDIGEPELYVTNGKPTLAMKDEFIKKFKESEEYKTLEEEEYQKQLIIAREKAVEKEINKMEKQNAKAVTEAFTEKLVNKATESNPFTTLAEITEMLKNYNFNDFTGGTVETYNKIDNGVVKGIFTFNLVDTKGKTHQITQEKEGNTVFEGNASIDTYGNILHWNGM